jgi:hypothetical protein
MLIDLFLNAQLHGILVAMPDKDMYRIKPFDHRLANFVRL